MIDKLDFILALARERHFGRAAEACGVTQPTLSAGVKQLEEQMGVLLVNRGSRFQGFTPEGERVLDWARRIVGDTRSMREEINALRHGLTGQLRIAAIPTTLGMVAALTTPYRERHPNVRFTIYSRTSIEILDLIENLEVDAGITYVGNEPLGRVTAIPLYHERYHAADVGGCAARQPRRGDVGGGGAGAALPADAGHAEPPHHRPAAARRGLGGAADAGVGFDDPAVLARAHRALGERDAAKLAETLGLTETIRAIPIKEPEAVQTIGLVVPSREPMMPNTAALVAEARQLAASLDRDL